MPALCQVSCVGATAVRIGVSSRALLGKPEGRDGHGLVSKLGNCNSLLTALQLRLCGGVVWPAKVFYLALPAFCREVDGSLRVQGVQELIGARKHLQVLL